MGIEEAVDMDISAAMVVVVDAEPQPEDASQPELEELDALSDELDEP
jgi:hypothetical protein